MRPRLALLALAVCALSAIPAAAGEILERIKAQKLLRCGGVVRPGLVLVDDTTAAHGLELDICKALASVVLGTDGRIEFRLYNSEMAFQAAREGRDDVSFLTGFEIIQNGLAGKVVPGPTVFIQSTGVMVHGDSKVARLEQMTDQSICFFTGDHPESHLGAWAAAHHLSFIHMAFSEDGEMLDAFDVKHCDGLAAEVTTLANVRRIGGERMADHRILPDALATYPIIAATGVTDAQWSSVVAWTIHTLIRADAPGSYWVVPGLDSIPVRAPELGLDEGWQKRIVGIVGSYADIYRRNLGDDSPLRLPRGPNALPEDGGLLMSPFAE